MKTEYSELSNFLKKNCSNILNRIVFNGILYLFELHKYLILAFMEEHRREIIAHAFNNE